MAADEFTPEQQAALARAQAKSAPTVGPWLNAPPTTNYSSPLLNQPPPRTVEELQQDLYTPEQRAAIARAQYAATRPDTAASGPLSFVHGLGASVANVADIGAQAVGAVADLPRTANNLLNDPEALTPLPGSLRAQGVGGAPKGTPYGTEHQSGVYPVKDETSPTGVAWKTPPSSSPVGDLYNRVFPADPNHPYWDVAGQLAGPAIVESGLNTPGALSTLGGAARAAGRAAVTTGASGAGLAGGGAVGEALAGPPGRAVGQIAGAAAAPAIVSMVPWVARSGAASALTTSETPGLYNLFQSQGVTPTLESTGSPMAAGIGKWAPYVPFGGGGRIEEARTAQLRQLDRNFTAIADARRGGPSGDLSPDIVGARVNDAVQGARTNISTAQENLYGPVRAQIGDAAVDPNPQVLRDQLQTGGDQASAGRPRDTFDRFATNVAENTYDPRQPPKIADPALEATLQNQRQFLESSIASASDPATVQVLQQHLDAVNGAIQDNRGLTFRNQLDVKKEASRNYDRSEGLDVGTARAIKSNIDEAMNRTAVSRGVTNLPQVNRDYRDLELQDQRLQPFVDAQGNPINNAAAYDRMFSGKGNRADKSTEILDVLNRYGPPGSMPHVLADRLDMITRDKNTGLPAGQLPHVPRPGLIDWWNKSPEIFREGMAGAPGTPERNAVAANIAIQDALATRGKGVTGANPINPGVRTGVGALGALASGIGLHFSPAFGAAAGIPLATQVLSRVLSNPEWTRYLASTPGLAQQFDRTGALSRILAGAVGGAQVQANQPGQ